MEIIALAAWAAGMTGVLLLDDPRLRFPAWVAGMLVSGCAFAHLLRRGLDPKLQGVALLLAIAVRVAFILTPPALSDDVFRYVYEGRVVWTMGPAFPFTHAPLNAAADGVPPELLDAAWLRINHPELATIYPPFAQLVFAIAHGHLVVLKIAIVAFELAAYAFVARARGRDAAIVLLLSPLAAFELAHEGHADSLSMFGLAIGATFFAVARPKLGYAGFALAALAKLNGLVAMIPAIRATRRGLFVALAMLVPLALPYVLAGRAETAALFAYGGAWRSGDGIFSVFLWIAETIIGGDWTRIGGATITRHQLARAIDVCAFAGVAFAFCRRPLELERVPELAATLLLVVLLFSPTLHPWYALWLLPLYPFAGRMRPAIAVLLVLAPLLHHGTWLELTDGKWSELGFIRALVHVPVWLVFGYALRACPSKKAS